MPAERSSSLFEPVLTRREWLVQTVAVAAWTLALGYFWLW